MLHHNFFPFMSSNSKYETRALMNIGKAINILSQCNCDIVLHGHTHRPEIALHQSSSFYDSGYKGNKKLLFISSGTSGGEAPSRDIAKSFNIIDISFDVENQRRRVLITPYAYNSMNVNWSEREGVTFYL